MISKSNKLINLYRYRYTIWLISGFAIVLSLTGLITSWLNPSIGYPLRLGLDFTGGTQIKVERVCLQDCSAIDSSAITGSLIKLSSSKKGPFEGVNLSSAKIQTLDNYQTLLVRLPFLSTTQSKEVIKAVELLAGPFDSEKQSIDTIGPSLGARLLRTSLISLLAAFAGIAIYIAYRFDKRFSLLAIVALLHDLIIVCGIFAWLGLIINLEINSLFAVALLTIAGYSVNDTVVIFDRIREINNLETSLTISQQIDLAVAATLSRTLYTSGSTLLPLIALIAFGGSTLYWFSIALAIGVVVGSWSSIALSPSLLSIKKNV